MINHHFVKNLHKFVNNNKVLKIQLCKSFFSKRNHHSDIQFKDVYSINNLERCLNQLNGLIYSKSTVEERNKFFEIKKENAKKAGVLIPLCFNESNKSSIIFTLRSPKLSTHKHEICFPGGILSNKDDGDVCKTAVRETTEELGISDDSINVLGVFNPIAGKQSNSFVFPVLAIVDLTKEGKHNIEFHNKCKDEVDEVIIRPLSELVKETNWNFTHWRNGMTTPIYRDEVFNDLKSEHNVPRIWGLTGYLLYLVLKNLVPDHFKLEYNLLERYKVEKVNNWP